MRRTASSTLIFSALTLCLSPAAWAGSFITSLHHDRPLQTLAYPAGSAQTQIIRLPWSGTHLVRHPSTPLPTLHTQQVPTGVTLQLRGGSPSPSPPGWLRVCMLRSLA